MRWKGAAWHQAGHFYRIRGLGDAVVWGIAGIVILLWYPRAKEFFNPPPQPASTSASWSAAQMSERYTRALQQLSGQNTVEVRVGSIYELELIAQDSPLYHWPVMELLYTYLRENAAVWKRKAVPVVPRPEDWDAIVTVLRRRDATRDGEGRYLNLSAVQLYRANLRSADLHGADLTHADLFEADLSNANLQRAILTGANLIGASLRRADLRNAYLGAREHTDPASLYYADLDGADLRGADLSFVRGLTRVQLSRATLNSETNLPQDMRKPEMKD